MRQRRELTDHLDTRHDQDPEAFDKTTSLLKEMDLAPEGFMAWAPRLSENEVHMLYVEHWMNLVNKARYVEVNGKPVIMPDLHKVEFKVNLECELIATITKDNQNILAMTKTGKYYLFQGDF